MAEATEHDRIMSKYQAEIDEYKRAIEEVHAQIEEDKRAIAAAEPSQSDARIPLHKRLEPEMLTLALQDESSPKKRRTVPFDIIVYVDMHGVCGFNKDNGYDIPFNVPDGINLSIMRAGEYGVATSGKHRMEFITDVIARMKPHSTKDDIFRGLQRMFRYQKQTEDKLPAPADATYKDIRHYRNFENIPGWNYVIDGQTFVQTYYSTDDEYKYITVIYDKNAENIGSKITLNDLSLAHLVVYLKDAGYKNIGIIENSCRTVHRQTTRQGNLANNKLKRDFPNVMGGRKRTKRRRTRKNKLG
jgi:hypothetical protein